MTIIIIMLPENHGCAMTADEVKFLFLAARAEREPVSSYKFKKLTELKGISRAFSKKRDFQGTFAISHLGQMYRILIKNLY